MSKSKKRYYALIDPDDLRSGSVRLDPVYNEDDASYGGGQLIFEWYCPRNNDRCGRPPKKVERLVALANKALDGLG